MSDFSHYKILDDILEFCEKFETEREGAYKYTRLYDIYDNLIVADKDGKYEKDRRTLRQAIDKLLEEKYLAFQSRVANNEDQWMVVLTFDGQLLIKDGGYVKRVADDAYENTRLRKIETDQHKSNQDVRVLTYWIALGAVIMAVYTPLQIFDWLHEHHYLYYSILKNTWIAF